MSPSLSLARLSFLAFVATTTAVGQSTVLVPCDRDNTLYEDPAGTLSNGAGTSLFVGRPGGGGLIRRAVLHFDVAASVPAGARVLAATLTVNVVGSAAQAPLDVTGHFLVEAWGEGGSGTAGGAGAGAPAMPGDATWIHTFYPNTLWAIAGGTFDPTPSFTMTTPQSGLATSPITAEFVNSVQFWVDNPALNYGLLLKMVNETLSPSARRIDSRESPGIRPSMLVTYTMAGTVGTYGIGCPVGSGTFAAAFVGVPTGGATIQLAQSDGPANSIGANFFALGLDPVGVPLFPSCTVWLPPTFVPGNTFPLDAGGTATSPFVVPIGFPGYLIVAQSAALANSPLGFVLSNAAYVHLP